MLCAHLRHSFLYNLVQKYVNCKEGDDYEKMFSSFGELGEVELCLSESLKERVDEGLGDSKRWIDGLNVSESAIYHALDDVFQEDLDMLRDSLARFVSVDKLFR